MLFSRQALLWAIQSSSLAVAQASTLRGPPDSSSHVYINSSSSTSSSSTNVQESPIRLDTAVSPTSASTSAPISYNGISRSIISKTTETTSNSTTNSRAIPPVILPPQTSPPVVTAASPNLPGTSESLGGGTNVEAGGGTGRGGEFPTATPTPFPASTQSVPISVPTQYTSTGRISTSIWANTTTYRNISTATSSYTTPNTTIFIPTTSHNGSITTPCITLADDEPSTVWEIVPNTSTTTITVYANATNATMSMYSTLPEFTPPIYCPTPVATSTTENVPGPVISEPPEPPKGSTAYYSMSRSNTPFGTSEGYGATARPVTTVVITSKNPTTLFTTVGPLNYPGQDTDKVKPTDVNWGPIGPPVPPGDSTPTPIDIVTVGPTQTPPPSNSGNNGGSGNPPANNPPANNPPANNPPANNPPSNNPPSSNPPSSNPPPGNNDSPGNNPGSPGSGSKSDSGTNQPGNGAATTRAVGGIPVVVEPTRVIIGTQTVPVPTGNSGSEGSSGANGGSGNKPGSSGSGSGSGSNGAGSGSNGINPSNGGSGVTTDSSGNEIVVQDGQTFTVNPSQVIGPGGTTMNIPTPNPTVGGQFRESPKTTVISGLPVQLGHSIAIISGTTYSIGPGAPQTTITVSGQTISVGPDGLGFASTTVAPEPSLPTNIVVIDGEVFSAIGPSLAVIGTSTITYGGNIPPTTNTFNGATITLAPSGIFYGATSLGGNSNPANTQLGLAGGMTISEIGSTLAVINGVTLTVGPGATPSVTVIDGNTVTAGPLGLGLASTTLSYPFNPTTRPVTAGGITYSEIGPSLVVIGGSTFTVGPGAKTTSDIYGGQTISIGPGGVGFSTTTVPPASATTDASATSTKKKSSASSRAGSGSGVLGMFCIGLSMAFMI